MTIAYGRGLRETISCIIENVIGPLCHVMRSENALAFVMRVIVAKRGMIWWSQRDKNIMACVGRSPVLSLLLHSQLVKETRNIKNGLRKAMWPSSFQHDAFACVPPIP